MEIIRNILRMREQIAFKGPANEAKHFSAACQVGINQLMNAFKCLNQLCTLPSA